MEARFKSFTVDHPNGEYYRKTYISRKDKEIIEAINKNTSKIKPRNNDQKLKVLSTVLFLLCECHRNNDQKLKEFYYVALETAGVFHGNNDQKLKVFFKTELQDTMEEIVETMIKN